MRHLVLITTSFPSSNDGSEAAGSFVIDLSVALAQKIRVTVIAPGAQTGAEQFCDNLIIRRFQVPRRPLSLLKANNLFHWPGILRTLIAGKIEVQRVVSEETIDHILALWVLPSGYWARSVASKQGIQYSTWALGSDIWSLGKVPLVRALLKKVLRDSFINFADGYQLKEDVTTLSGRTCTFLPSARQLDIPREKKISSNPPYRLAFLGRWHRNKGIDILLESLVHLQDDDWQRIEEVRICGGGPMENIVKSGIATLQKQKRPVVARGYLNKVEAVELLLWADYVLIPSRIESIPVIFSDAMKCRCPMICMPVGDLSRLLLQNQVGILVKKVTGQCFANAISDALRVSPQNFAHGLRQSSYDYDLYHITKNLLFQLGYND